MSLRRLFALLAAGWLVSLSVVLPAFAAEPDGVVFDATVTVTFTEAVDDFDTVGPPIAGATVTLAATVNDFDPPVQTLEATTEADGTATFSGVGRSAEGGPTVLLAVAATFETSETTADGCTRTESWFGLEADIESSAAVAVDLVGLPSSSIACPAPDAPPDGVALDGTAEVTVVAADSGVPLAGAAVVLRAGLADGEPFQELTGTSGPDGVVTFLGVARPAEAGVEVSLEAEASLLTTEDVDGCTFERSWHGSATAPAGDEPAALDVEAVAGPLEFVACADPADHAPVLHGTIRTADGDVPAVDRAHVEMTRADGARWTSPFEPAADGSFSVRIQPWGTADAAARLVVVVVGPAESERTEGDCVYQVGQLGTVSLEVALADGSSPAPIEVVTALGDLSGVCGTTGTPPPSAPSITLPPTDGSPVVAGAADLSPLLPGLLVTLGLATLAAGGSAWRRRGS